MQHQEDGGKHPRDIFADLQRLRDATRLKVHLAGLDARDEWEQLEKKIAELEAQVAESGARISQAIADRSRQLRSKLNEFMQRNLPH